MFSIQPAERHSGCLSQQGWLVSKLRDVTAFELGKAASAVRALLASMHFDEVVLSPFETYPIDYLDNVLDVEGVGQLRFNTEPEIWEASRDCDQYYSISALFRKETTTSVLRRSSFFILDIYQLGAPDSMLPIFQAVLAKLADGGFTQQLSRLPFVEAEYDASLDGPRGSFNDFRWVIASGYDAGNSFFEINDSGVSTRLEIFLATPFGFLEIGVVGITGWNRNPDYVLRSPEGAKIKPDLRRSGLGIGLERLLLAEQIVSLARSSAP